MAKRFADTKLTRKKWFRKLSPTLKCALRFLFDECDGAGVWDLDEETLDHFVGAPVDLDALIQGVNVDDAIRIERLGKNKIFLPGFVLFQYGELSPKCKPHIPVIKRLKELNLWEGYLKGLQTLKDKEMEMEEETEGGSGGKPAAAPPESPPETPDGMPSCPACHDVGHFTGTERTSRSEVAFRCLCPAGKRKKGPYLAWSPSLSDRYEIVAEPRAG